MRLASSCTVIDSGTLMSRTWRAWPAPPPWPRCCFSRARRSAARLRVRTLSSLSSARVTVSLPCRRSSTRPRLGRAGRPRLPPSSSSTIGVIAPSGRRPPTGRASTGRSAASSSAFFLSSARIFSSSAASARSIASRRLASSSACMRCSSASRSIAASRSCAVSRSGCAGAAARPRGGRGGGAAAARRRLRRTHRRRRRHGRGRFGGRGDRFENGGWLGGGRLGARRDDRALDRCEHHRRRHGAGRLGRRQRTLVDDGSRGRRCGGRRGGGLGDRSRGRGGSRRRDFDDGLLARRVAGAVENARTLDLDHHRLRPAVAEALLDLADLDRLVEAERGAHAELGFVVVAHLRP